MSTCAPYSFYSTFFDSLEIVARSSLQGYVAFTLVKSQLQIQQMAAFLPISLPLLWSLASDPTSWVSWPSISRPVAPQSQLQTTTQ